MYFIDLFWIHISYWGFSSNCNKHQKFISLILKYLCMSLFLIGKPEGRRPFGWPRHRWEDNIRMDLTEIWWDGVEWMHMAQDRNHWWIFVSMVMNLWVPQKAGNFLDWVMISFSRRTLPHVVILYVPLWSLGGFTCLSCLFLAWSWTERIRVYLKSTIESEIKKTLKIFYKWATHSMRRSCNLCHIESKTK